MRNPQFEQGRLPVANLNRQTVRAQNEDSDEEEIQAQHDGTQPASAWMQLQRAHGNRFVQRVVDLMRSEDGEGDISPEIERTIHGARGGGHALDSGVRARMEPAFKADFGGVRVHTDSRADALNRSLSARAFTTGQDIFFKQGEYSPGSSSGRELLAHELTHVVQQNGNGVQTKLTLGRPGDKYEQEADSMAQAVLQKEQRGLQRQEEEEEEEEEVEPVQARGEGVQRQEEEEVELETIGISDHNSLDIAEYPVQKSRDRLASQNISLSANRIQRFGAGGHEETTERGLEGMFDKKQMQEIQLGNWKTDMNQISLTVPHFKRFGIDLSPSDCTEIVKILAIDKFGEVIGSRVSQTSLGEYMEEEHFDNPNEEKADLIVQPFFTKSNDLIKCRLHKVVALGNTPEVRELLGKVLHTVQDLYAHSNFVEIAMAEMQKPVDTLGGKTSGGALIMTSGTFGGLDTAISIVKIIADKLKEPTPAGKRLSASTRIVLILLNRSKYAWIGRAYLKMLDMKERAKKWVISHAPKRIRHFVERFIRRIEMAMQQAKDWLAGKMADVMNSVADAASKRTGGGIHPSHSQLAKDYDSEKRGLYPLASKLATVATTDITKQVMRIWQMHEKGSDKDQIDTATEALDRMVVMYLAHPNDIVSNNWWRQYMPSR